jgi:outer membrane biosynthesis protein TonB
MRMFSRSRCSLAIAAALMSLSARAGAELLLPPRSPQARVSQRVGLTDISVEYTSPAVRERWIWDVVVPYGKVWRTGELPVPKITFSRDVVFVDKNVPAGTYALLTIPTADSWTIILNRNAKLTGERAYRPELDVARVEVPWTPAPHRERFAFVFTDFTDDEVRLDLEWETRRVSIPIKVHTAEQLVAEIGALDGVWRKYADMARYLLDKGDYDAGLDYVDRSLILKRDAYNVAIRASLLEAKGRRGDRGPTDDKAHRASRTAPTPREEVLTAPTMQKAFVNAGEPFSSIHERGGASLEPARAPSASIGERGGASLEPARAPSASIGERRVRVLGGGGSASKAPGPDEIGPLVKKGKGDIQACYQRALRQDPTLTRGKLTISVTIGVSGMVKNVAFGSGSGFQALEPCVKGAISRWVFPLSPVEYETEFPVVLRGRD